MQRRPWPCWPALANLSTTTDRRQIRNCNTRNCSKIFLANLSSNGGRGGQTLLLLLNQRMGHGPAMWTGTESMWEINKESNNLAMNDLSVFVSNRWHYISLTSMPLICQCTWKGQRHWWRLELLIDDSCFDSRISFEFECIFAPLIAVAATAKLITENYPVCLRMNSMLEHGAKSS